MRDFIEFIIIVAMRLYSTYVGEIKKSKHACFKGCLNATGFNDSTEVQVHEKTEVDISLNFIHEDHASYIDVENIGNGTAYDVYIEIMGDFIKISKRQLLLVNNIAHFEHCKLALPELICCPSIEVVVTWYDIEHESYEKRKRLIGSF